MVFIQFCTSEKPIREGVKQRASGGGRKRQKPHEICKLQGEDVRAAINMKIPSSANNDCSSVSTMRPENIRDMISHNGKENIIVRVKEADRIKVVPKLRFFEKSKAETTARECGTIQT